MGGERCSICLGDRDGGLWMRKVVVVSDIGCLWWGKKSFLKVVRVGVISELKVFGRKIDNTVI